MATEKLLETPQEEIQPTEEVASEPEKEPRYTPEEQAIIDSGFSPKEAAKEKGVTISGKKIRKLLRAGKVDAHRIKGRWFFDHDQLKKLKDFLKAQAKVKEEAQKATLEKLDAAKAEKTKPDQKG